MTPGVATLRKDPASAAAESEAADVALAASGDARAFERLYRTHLARIRLAVNLVLGRRKALALERGRQESDPDALDELSGPMDTPGMALDFEQAIGRLPDGAKQVFLLHDVAGYRHEEIATLLGIVVGTSKSQLHHARMALRKHLD